MTQNQVQAQLGCPNGLLPTFDQGQEDAGALSGERPELHPTGCRLSVVVVMKNLVLDEFGEALQILEGDDSIPQAMIIF